MNVTLLFVALAGAILIWFALLSKLKSKSWLAKGVISEDGITAVPPQRVGLWLFLGVVTSLFSLFMIIYSERATFPDWRPIVDPQLLWFNTALLVVASIALQRARNAANRNALSSIRTNLSIGGIFTIGFLIGQVIAWRELTGTGHFFATNPADAFFYLLTGLHGLHLLGGLYVWAKTMTNAWHAPDPDDIRPAAALKLSVQLCSFYWHYLLLLWLLLFYLLLST
jgi:cytochrome c oxidase subunit 3